MATNPDGIWCPELAPKGMQVFNFQATKFPCEMAPALLVAGPRETGKSICCEHKLVRHMWETDGARVGIVGKTYKNVKEAGVIKDLVEFVLPQWLRANLKGVDGKTPFEYSTVSVEGDPGPKTDSVTKTWYFRIRNYWGTESELMLYSLDHDKDVEDKLKNTRFSCLYFPELDRFKDKKVFTVSFHQLRMIHLRPDQHLWLADTNPAQEGPNHFAYQLFYQSLKTETEDEVLYRNFGLVEMGFADNPWLSPGRIAAIKALYRSDPDLWNRYVLGLWVKLREQGAFADVFNREIHVVGDLSPADPKEQSILMPDETTEAFIGGWDPGDVNHSAHILSKRAGLVSFVDEETGKTETREEFLFEVLDELVVIKGKITIREFTWEFMELMDYWEKKFHGNYGRKLPWRHWSDASAWNFEAGGGNTDERIVRVASENRIILAAPGGQKSEGSPKRRRSFLKRLLYEQRIFISAKCVHTIEMIQNMTDVLKNNPFKHPFDSLTYALQAEEPHGVAMQLSPKTTRPTNVITVGAT